MSTGAEKTSPIDRIATGVPGLDEILGGGLLRSGVYIFQGSPGAGKTILANHIVHRHAASGGKVVYVTMLAESHGRMMQHMEGFSFFDLSATAGRLQDDVMFCHVLKASYPETVSRRGISILWNSASSSETSASATSSGEPARSTQPPRLYCAE